LILNLTSKAEQKNNGNEHKCLKRKKFTATINVKNRLQNN